MSTLSRKLWNDWKNIIPATGAFRMSVRMWYGKNETMKYRYVNFTSRKQFKTWLVENEDRLYSIVDLK